jgi:hypothetical protein
MVYLSYLYLLSIVNGNRIVGVMIDGPSEDEKRDVAFLMLRYASMLHGSMWNDVGLLKLCFLLRSRSLILAFLSKHCNYVPISCKRSLHTPKDLVESMLPSR